MWYFISSLHGAFVSRRREIDPELLDVYDKIFQLEEMMHPIEDKKNMSSDVQALRNDMKKALKAYKIEHKLEEHNG